MATIFSYIKKYKNASRADLTFNILDALILTGIAYLPLPESPQNRLNDHDMLGHLLSVFIDHPTAYKSCVMPLTDLKFARILVKCPRYKDIWMYGDYQSIDTVEQKQFRAITFVDKTQTECFIAFSGTDTTLVGWKEDFDLIHKKVVPSQVLAASYLEKISEKFPNARIHMGGHSKGGNLAMYAASFAKLEVQKKLGYVFNFDGPGLQKEEFESEGYNRVRKHIVSILPHYSMVGILFGFSDDYRIIKTSGPIALNHSFYYWRIKGLDFVYSHKISKMSIKTGMVVKYAYNRFTNAERQALIDNFFRVFTAGGAKSTHQVFKDLKHAIIGASEEFMLLNRDEQYKMITTFSDIFGSYFRFMTREEKDAKKAIEAGAGKHIKKNK